MATRGDGYSECAEFMPTCDSAHGLPRISPMMVRFSYAIWLMGGLVVVGSLTAAFFGAAGAGPRPEESSIVQQEAAETLSPVRAGEERRHGPALDVPQEVLEMLNQRQRAVERREEAVRIGEARLQTLRDEIQQIVSRHEQLVKAAEASRQQGKKTKAETNESTVKTTIQQVATIYEAMPAEEAAARLEKMPMEKSLQVLRSLKGKTAGAILSQMKPDKAAKLTEQLLGGSSSFIRQAAR